MSDEEIALDLAELLGATEASVQQLTLYIPDKDKDGNQQKDLNKWIYEAQEVLTAIGGGTTSMPPADGTWLNPDSNETIREETKMIFTYIEPDRFEANLARLREFLHRFGRETNQGEVAFEFDGAFYRIKEFDRLEKQEKGDR